VPTGRPHVPPTPYPRQQPPNPDQPINRPTARYNGQRVEADRNGGSSCRAI
jgi:hypothetical protein